MNRVSRWTALLLAGSAACVADDFRTHFASLVEDFLPAPGLDPDAPYADPSRAVGPPDGRTVAVGEGATLLLRFFRPVENGPGPDLRVIEIGSDGARARIAVSEDSERFHEFAEPATDGGATVYDLEELGLETIRAVRVRGIDDNGDDPGFDLDAVESLQ